MARNFSVDCRELNALTQRVAHAVNTGARKSMREAIRDAAERFLVEVIHRTPEQTGELRYRWRLDNASVRVRAEGDGYKVTLHNRAPYASWVEKGHWQRGRDGQLQVVRNRTVPYYEGENADTYVFGVFYVKKTELHLESQHVIDNVVRQHMEDLFNRTF